MPQAASEFPGTEALSAFVKQNIANTLFDRHSPYEYVLELLDVCAEDIDRETAFRQYWELPGVQSEYEVAPKRSIAVKKRTKQTGLQAETEGTAEEELEAQEAQRVAALAALAADSDNDDDVSDADDELANQLAGTKLVEPAAAPKPTTGKSKKKKKKSAPAKTPEPTPEPVAAPAKTPEPAAATPEPEPEPSAAASQAEPEPEPTAAAAATTTTPEPSATNIADFDDDDYYSLKQVAVLPDEEEENEIDEAEAEAERIEHLRESLLQLADELEEQRDYVRGLHHQANAQAGLFAALQGASNSAPQAFKAIDTKLTGYEATLREKIAQRYGKIDGIAAKAEAFEKKIIRDL